MLKIEGKKQCLRNLKFLIKNKTLLRILTSLVILGSFDKQISNLTNKKNNDS